MPKPTRDLTREEKARGLTKPIRAKLLRNLSGEIEFPDRGKKWLEAYTSMLCLLTGLEIRPLQVENITEEEMGAAPRYFATEIPLEDFINGVVRPPEPLILYRCIERSIRPTLYMVPPKLENWFKPASVQ